MAEIGITTHMFVIGPNNSGTTLLRNLIAANGPCASLPMEGQHTPGFIGPSSRGTGTRLIWASRAEWIANFRDPAHYDWRETRTAWHVQAAKVDDLGAPVKPVFVTSSPPFLLIVDQLRAAFPDAFFVFLVRDPYAAIEGIIRRAGQQPLSGNENIAEVAARHISACLQYNLQNIEKHRDVGIALTYEDLCADPAQAARKIGALVPDLADLQFDAQVPVKGVPAAAIANKNAEQIARLTTEELEKANGVFKYHIHTMARFGYHLRGHDDA